MNKRALPIVVLSLIIFSLLAYFVYEKYYSGPRPRERRGEQGETRGQGYSELKNKALKIYERILYELHMLNKSRPHIDWRSLASRYECSPEGIYGETLEKIRREHLRNSSLVMALKDFHSAIDLINICINVSEGLPVDMRPTEAKALYHICKATLTQIYSSGVAIRNMSVYRGIISRLEDVIYSKNCIVDDRINSTCVEHYGGRLLESITRHIRDFYVTYKLVFNLLKDGYVSLTDIEYIRNNYLNKAYALLENLSRIYGVYDKYFILLWGRCGAGDAVYDQAYIEFAREQLSRSEEEIDVVENHIRRSPSKKVPVDEDYFLENIGIPLSNLISDVTDIAIYLYDLGYANYIMYNYMLFSVRYSMITDLLGDFNSSCIERSVEELIAGMNNEIDGLADYLSLMGLNDLAKYARSYYSSTSIECRACRYLHNIVSLALVRAGYIVYTSRLADIAEYRAEPVWAPILNYSTSIAKDIRVLADIVNYTNENIGYDLEDPVDDLIGYHESAIRRLNYEFSQSYRFPELYQKLVNDQLSDRDIERFIEDMLRFYRKINSTKVFLLKIYMLIEEYLRILPQVINEQNNRINIILDNCRR